MNRLMLLAVAIGLAAPAAWGQLYKYVDKDGKTVYTDQPPASAESKAIKPPPPAPAAPAATPGDKARDVPKASRPATAAAPRKADATPLTAEEKEARCQAARANYVIFLDGGPVTMRNTRTGERFQLEEKEAEAEKARAKAAMDEACKKPE